MAIRVQVTRNRLPDIAAQLPEATDVIVNRKHGPRMRDAAARYSRVDSGEMRDGWQWEATGQGQGQLINRVPHTGFNEFGTRHMSAQPMARPALEEIGPDIVDDMENIGRFLR